MPGKTPLNSALYGEYMTKISETSVAERSLELRRLADGRDIAFLIIPFSATDHMEEVTSLITQTLVEYDICCLRSDQRRISDDLWENIRIYMHAADYGVAVFERVDTSDYNPNVSIEVGYMMALGTPLCLLKEKRLPRLPSDIAGKLYQEFDMLSRTSSVPSAVNQWASSLGIVRKNLLQKQSKPQFVILPPGVGPKSLKRLLRPLLESDIIPEAELREVSRLGSHSFARHIGYLRINRLIVQAEEGQRPVSLTDSGKVYAAALFSGKAVADVSSNT